MKSTLSLYLTEISKYNLLTSDEEKQLSKSIIEGLEAKDKLNSLNLSLEEFSNLKIIESKGLKAQEKLINSNLKLVVCVAKEFKSHNMDIMDLIQEGNVGLCHAVLKYDYRHNTKFSTYAAYWIRQSITRSLYNAGRLIKLPNHIKDKLVSFNKARYTLEDKLGREATIKELSKELNMDEIEIFNLNNYNLNVVSLDVLVGDGKTTLSEFVEDNEATPYEKSRGKHLKKTIKDMLMDLSDRERFVIERMFGFYDGQKWSLESIGDKLTLSRERIRQIEKSAINKLKCNKNVDMLKSYLI